MGARREGEGGGSKKRKASKELLVEIGETKLQWSMGKTTGSGMRGENGLM